jgi:leucyl-tRNA synthetase
MDEYDAQTIEEKWQAVWEAERAFMVENPAPGEELPEPHFYMLEMLPYPSGTLHMGHVLNYTLGDVVTHFRRRNGYTVLRPMGYDSFGLPAENAAIKEGGHPLEITERNIAAIGRQMRRMGWAIDWDREVSAHEPTFYHWTQWLFLKFFEHGLAYREEAPVKWCPNDQTVLSNEHVVDGRCWRCGAVVETRNMAQWFFKITAYADELIADLDAVDWPERSKKIQRDHIGRSEGAEVLFRVEELDIDIPVFTTRPDTLFGATFFVIAPESPLVDQLVEGTERAGGVRAYARVAAARPTEERATREKTGVFTGQFATNPVNGDRLPIWVADYVLMEYGTGAIMAVPAHDGRDLEFAQAYDLPVRTVIDEDGIVVNSGEFDGLPWREAIPAITRWLDERGFGKQAIHYRLHDWSFSRQRYWGCPIPIVYCEQDGIVGIPEDQLPVLLPDVSDYRPKGKPPLASNTDFINTTCPKCGGPAKREADTMDTFVDSAWYYLRYTDPHDAEAAFAREIVDYWMPIGLYVGGIDHVKGHLLYSRFFVKVLNDLGLLGFREPFHRLWHQGWVKQGGTKMSKSRGNVTGPDQLIEAYGADATRLYILFLGPADQDMDWTPEGVEGMVRFVKRLWRVVNEAAAQPPSPEGVDTPLARKAHETIARFSDDVGRRFVFNTPISAVMELVNELSKAPADPAARFAAETAVSLIQPYAPHVAEELWSTLGHERLWSTAWPVADERLLQHDTVELVLQVNGKVRDRIQVPAGLPEDELVERARASEKVRAHLNGEEQRVVVVPDKLVNIVV